MQTLFDWLSNPSYRALALSLLASLWQAALICLVVYGLLLLNKNAPARIKYNITAAGQLIIACWFIQTFLHHLSVQNQISQTLSDHEAAMLFYPGKFPLLSGLYSEDLSGSGIQLANFIPLALCVYIIGVLIMLVRIGFAYGQTRVLKTKGLFTAPSTYLNHLQEICGQLNINTHVRLYLSNRVNVPVMMGFIKPIILLPVSIATHLTSAQIEAIITHELAHIRRQDYLMNFIQSVIEALFFFNPFVWILSKIMREEREKACDELVIREVSAYTYATALLALEKINGTKSLSLAANGHKSFKLLNRIKLFTMKQNPIMTVRQKAFSLLLIVAGLGSIAWLSPDSTIKNKATAKEISMQNSASFIDQSNLIADSGQDSKDTAIKSTTAAATVRKHHSVIYKDSLSPEMQKQIDEITKSAQQLAQKATSDTSWKASIKAIREKAQKLSLKFEQDPEWKNSVEQLSRDANALSQKMKSDPAFKQQMKDLRTKAHDMQKTAQLSPDIQKQVDEIRKKSLQIAFQITNDTAWKKQLKTIRFKAQELAQQMKEDPEFARQIKEMAEKSKDIAFKVLNDPNFKVQLEKLQFDLKKLKTLDNTED